MRRPSGLLLAGIFFLIAIVVLINIPREINVAIETKPLPFADKGISIHQKYPGFNPNFFIGDTQFQKDMAFRLGLDLEGGTSVTLRADMKDVPADKRAEALESAKDVIERRVNFYGVSEPIIQTSRVGQEHRIIVEIPGVTDVNEAIKLIGKTAQLSFWEEGLATGEAEIASSSAYPFGMTQLLGANPQKTNLSGSDLQQATVGFDATSGKPQVQLNFTAQGGKKFADITRRNVGKIVVIALDDQVIEAPRVNEPITGGTAVITGGFTTEQAKALRIQLNAGALPVSLSVLEQHAIGATLGNDSLQKSILAGSIGFLVIVMFMVGLYGRLGAIASLALAVYVLINLTLFRLIPVTLTLAGIAGFILSIGIAVDANILIFERMKEEMRAGKSKMAALELGFQRAWEPIRDSNVASLITSAVLYYFGSGVVRGFALTLAIGVLVSMFSAIFLTRTFLRVLYKG